MKMKTIRSNKYAILVLAAGTSSRLGRPKQLVEIGNSNLLSHTIDAASSTPNADVHIILGAYSTEILDEIKIDHPVHINPNWAKGMGNTIAFGISQIKCFEYQAVILTVCDQPYLEATHFEQLVHLYENDSKDIIVSKYRSGNGPPSLFSAQHFDQLGSLEGDLGAKSVVKNNLENVGFIDFKRGNIDIDQEEDLSLF